MIIAIFVVLCLLGTIVDHYKDFFNHSNPRSGTLQMDKVEGTTNAAFSDLSTSESKTNLELAEGGEIENRVEMKDDVKSVEG